MSTTLAPSPSVGVTASSAGRFGEPRMSLSRRQLAIAAALHLGIAFAVLHSAWGDPAHTIVGPSTIDGPGYGAKGIPNGDSIQLVWFVQWTSFAVLHHHDPLLTTYLNAPAGANLMWNALMPVAGTLLLPITATVGAPVAFNLLATLALALCGLAATACARRFTRSWQPALFAGVVYELSGFALAQSQGHQSIVLAAAFVPCVLLLVLDVASLRRSPLVGGLMLGIGAAATLYTWEETLLAAAVMSVLGVIVAVISAPSRVRAAWRAPAIAVGVAAVVAIVLAAPGLWVQFFGSMHIGAAALRGAKVWVIDLQNLVTPTQQQLVAPGPAVAASHSWTGDGFEWGGYLGLPLVVLSVAGAALLWRLAAARWLVVMLVVSVVLSLGPVLHVGGHNTGVLLPWALLAKVPIIRDILAARLAVFAALAAALLGAMAVDAFDVRRLRAVAAAAAALVVASLLPAPLPAQTLAVPAFFTRDTARIKQGATVLVAPYATPLLPQAMTWQVASGMRFRMPGGYVLQPGRYGGLLEWSSSSVTSQVMQHVAAGAVSTVTVREEASMRAELRRWSVSAVVVGPMPHRAEMVAVFDAVLNQSSSFVDGVDVWWHPLTAGAGP